MLTAAAAAIAKHDEQSESGGLRSPTSAFNTPSSTGRRGTFTNGLPSDSIDARLSNGLSTNDAAQNAEHVLALKAWGSMRFVRAGW